MKKWAQNLLSRMVITATKTQKRVQLEEEFVKDSIVFVMRACGYVFSQC